MLLGNGVDSHAGSLLIQRLEGSRFGIFALWVLNCAKRGESWSAGWWIVFGHLNWPPKPVFAETKLPGSEAFDQYHRAAALRTGPERRSRGSDFFFRSGLAATRPGSASSCKQSGS